MILKELFTSDNISNKSIIIQLRYNEELQQELKHNTSFLPDTASISERAYCYKNNITSIQTCRHCGKPLLFKKMNKGYAPTCGNKECRYKSVIEGNKHNHDYVSIQKKMRETYKAKTGYEHNMQNPEFVKQFFDKREQDTGERYAIASEKSKQNREKTFIEKYGTTDISKILHGDHVTKSIIEKYGSYENYQKIRSIKASESKKNTELNVLIEKLTEMNYTFIDSFLKDNITPYIKIKCNRCGNIFDISRQSVNIYYRTNSYNFCTICDYKDNTYRSNFEKDVLYEIKKLIPNIEILTNRYINKVECDIIIPEYKIAIECNGLYWHSELYKDKTYHYKKKETVEQSGYSLIQIWEDDWTLKKDIVLSRISSKLKLNKKIYARKCDIKNVDNNTAKEFLNENHLHGYIRSSINYGLYYNDELVELISIGKSRKVISKNKNIPYELLRFASKKYINVIGGFSKLIKQFKQDYNEELFSYIDLSWTDLNGTSYIKSGFELIGKSNIEYWWVNNRLHNPIRENRINYQKAKLVNAGYDKNKTEIEIMHERKFYRVFGPGNLIVKI